MKNAIQNLMKEQHLKRCFLLWNGIVDFIGNIRFLKLEWISIETLLFPPCTGFISPTTSILSPFPIQRINWWNHFLFWNFHLISLEQIAESLCWHKNFHYKLYIYKFMDRIDTNKRKLCCKTFSVREWSTSTRIEFQVVEIVAYTNSNEKNGWQPAEVTTSKNQRMLDVHCGSVVHTLRRPFINWTHEFHERSRKHRIE